VERLFGECIVPFTDLGDLQLRQANSPLRMSSGSGNANASLSSRVRL
jgi:hypothetical protein